MTHLRERLRANLPKILIMAGVLLVLAIPLMFLLEDFVREAIVQPLAYQVWLTRVILDALPQAVLLIAFLPLLLYIAIRSLKGRKARIWKAEPPPMASHGNLQTWLTRMNLVMGGSYSRERFDHQLGQVLLQVVAHQQRLPMRGTIRRIENGTIPLPPEIEPYIRAALSAGFSGKRKPFRWLLDLLRKRRTGMTAQELERHMTPALRYLEQQLRIQSVEVSNDR